MLQRLFRRKPTTLRERASDLASEVMDEENRPQALISAGIMALLVGGLMWWIWRQPGEASDLLEGTSLEDDLTAIEGIGPKTANVLRDAGVRSYHQLARMNPEEIQVILRESDMHSAEPDTWPEQARLAEQGDWKALKDLRHELDAGRRM